MTVDPLLTLADAARHYAFAVNAERAAQTTLTICPTETSMDAWQRAVRRSDNRRDDLCAAALRANGVNTTMRDCGADL